MTIDISPQDVRSLCGGAVFQPGDEGYDSGRGAWQAQVDQRPALLAYPGSAAEVAEVVRYAATAGLRIAAQSTGHNAAPLGDLSDTVLVRTSGLTGISIDPERRIARVGSGVLWEDVVNAAAPHGLYPLHGSSPDVAVAGYSLGGGLGWMARRHGLQANNLTALEVVTPDGELVRADAENHELLFWALRGGGGNYGVVTALEFTLYPYAEAYGGMLVWDWRDAEKVLEGWVDWAGSAPEEVTTSWRILQMPDLEEVPEPLRGRNVVIIDGAVAGLPEDEAAAIMAPLRALAPEIDMWATMPAAGLVRIHGDPEEPTAYVSDTALLSALDGAAQARLIALTGPDSGSQLQIVELRQLGGALARVPEGAGAVGRFDGDFLLFTGAITPVPELEAPGQAAAKALVDALSPWATGSHYLNFVEHRVDPRAGFGEETYARLVAVRDQYDPERRMRSNHPIS